jgi:quinol monooxygenase YgiN
MPTDRIHVIATLGALPGKRAPLCALLQGLLGPTRAEPGCLRYELVQPEDAPDTFVFIEEWESAEALEALFRAAHFQEALAALDGKVTGPPELRRYRVVAPRG